MQKQYRSQGLALLMAVAAFTSISIPGCGRIKELEATVDQLQKQIDDATKARDAAEKLAVGEIQMSKDEVARLQKLVMDSLCKPMIPLPADKVYTCAETGKVTQTGFFILRPDLTARDGECRMGLKAEGEGVMSCKAIDLNQAIEFRCNNAICRDKAAATFPPPAM